MPYGSSDTLYIPHPSLNTTQTLDSIASTSIELDTTGISASQASNPAFFQREETSFEVSVGMPLLRAGLSARSLLRP